MFYKGYFTDCIPPNDFPGKIIYRATNPSAHSPLSRHSQKTRSILRGKRFVEKVLDTGKKVDPLRFANPQKKRKRYTPGSTFLPESARLELNLCFYLIRILYKLTRFLILKT